MANSNYAARVYPVKALKLIVGLLGVGTVLVLPGSAVLLGLLEKHMDKRSAKKTLYYLKYSKLVDVKHREDGQIEYKLTDKGFRRHRKSKLEEIDIKTPKRWDKKWRMVVYDIPFSRQNETKRQYLIAHLRQNNFMMLQKSTWIHPFDCKEQVGVITDYLGLDKHVSYFRVDEGNFEKYATKHFKEIGLLI